MTWARKVLDQLEEREATVLRMRFGLDDEEPKTLKGASLGRAGRQAPAAGPVPVGGRPSPLGCHFLVVDEIGTPSVLLRCR